MIDNGFMTSHIQCIMNIQGISSSVLEVHLYNHEGSLATGQESTQQLLLLNC